MHKVVDDLLVARTAQEIATWDAAQLDAMLSGRVTSALDAERIFSAIVWTIIDTYSSPATIAKYTTARTKIISAFKTQPWKA